MNVERWCVDGWAPGSVPTNDTQNNLQPEADFL